MIKTALLLFFVFCSGKVFRPPRLRFQINPNESLFGKNPNLSFVSIYDWVYANLVVFL